LQKHKNIQKPKNSTNPGLTLALTLILILDQFQLLAICKDLETNKDYRIKVEIRRNIEIVS